MRILVVGGAGYIGSHVARHLRGRGHTVRTFDNLSLGHAAAVPPEELVVGDLADTSAIERAIAEHQIDAVMHFAANALVPESVADPAKYYRNNVTGTLNLLDAMRAQGVNRLVFSSSCATYGVPDRVPMTEDTPQRPINPYGQTKLVVERVLADYAPAYGLGSTSLRYFNASGASEDASIGEDHTPETHLIPIVLQAALGQRPSVMVCGTDYPTPDGSCVRDYIHVEDLADAHLRALERIEPGRARFYNLGTGVGASVRQVIEAARSVTGIDIPVVEGPRRPGDPPALVAAADRARDELGWVPRFTDIRAIVETAWRWHNTHPNGYRQA
jgi:UDP-glucose 4-epimerase